MPVRTPRRVSVSTWALHALIGAVSPGRPPSASPAGDRNARLMETREGTLDLPDVPAQLAAHGYRTMELCHFHVPTRDPGYLNELRAAREAAGVELWSLLIDDGDLNHPERGEGDRKWVSGWIDAAAMLGARCARVIAGKQPASVDSLARSIHQLGTLADYASSKGVRLMTENWFGTLATPSEVRRAFEDLGDSTGLCLDFGNWSGREKYGNLADIARYAESCHAKCAFHAGRPDMDDYKRCLDLTREADFSGPYTLVHGEPGDVWGSLEAQRALLEPYL